MSQGDVRHLTFDDCSVRTCVSNLPFGKQYTFQQDMKEWLRTALSEMARVTRPGGRMVLLAPSILHDSIPGDLRLTERVPIRLLGTKLTIWVYYRR